MTPPKDGEDITPEWMQDLHRNAQAVSILLGSVSLEEYNKISGLGVAHEIWTTLRESHEGDSKSKKGMIEVLEGELGDFAMLKGETLQSLYDRLMVKVNKIRSLGSEDWNDNKVTRLFLRAYQVKDKALARMIRDRDDYEMMKPHQLLAKLKQHEIEDDAATKTASRVSNAMVSHGEGTGKGVALQANKEKMIEESSSVEESSSGEENQNIAMFIKSFKKIFKGNKRFNKSYGDKGQRKEKKRPCYECGKIGHFIVKCTEKNKEGKKEYKKDKYNKGEKSKTYKKKRYQGHAHIGEEWVSGDESSSSEDEGVASIVIQRPSTPRLFTNLTDDYYTPT